MRIFAGTGRKRIVPAVLLLVLTGLLLICVSKRNVSLPIPEFPLSETALGDSLKLSGLDWHIGRTNQGRFFYKDSTPATTYSLSVPGDKADSPAIFITSFDSTQFGRVMQIFHYRNTDRLTDSQTINNASWEGCRDILKLAARLYGGFQSEDEIYQACSASPVPENERTLWQGQLSGGYCTIEALPTMRSWTAKKGGRLYVTIHENEDGFRLMQQETAWI